MNDRWLAVLSRITPFVPDDLDAVIMPDSPTAAAPDGVFLASIAPAPTPSSRLWDRVENEQSYLGIRLTAPHPNAAEAAIRLASAALERGIVPIILSRIDTSGFERFGFRVERVTGVSFGWYHGSRVLRVSRGAPSRGSVAARVVASIAQVDRVRILEESGQQLDCRFEVRPVDRLHDRVNVARRHRQRDRWNGFVCPLDATGIGAPSREDLHLMRNLVLLREVPEGVDQLRRADQG